MDAVEKGQSCLQDSDNAIKKNKCSDDGNDLVSRFLHWGDRLTRIIRQLVVYFWAMAVLVSEIGRKILSLSRSRHGRQPLES